MVLLSVDFDYFFPEPMGSGDGDPKCLWDWGHHEGFGDSIATYLWHTRASAFKRSGYELPTVNDEWRTFWDKFDIAEDVAVYVGDSHMWAGHDDISTLCFEEVVNFDAHHDLGYKNDLYDGDRMRVSCGNWLQLYSDVLRVMTTVVYPNWKKNAFKMEPHTNAKSAIISRMFEAKWNRRIAPDAIYIARSGAWVPPWCDTMFDEFVSLCPSKADRYNFELENGNKWIREYDESIVAKLTEQFNIVQETVNV